MQDLFHKLRLRREAKRSLSASDSILGHPYTWLIFTVAVLLIASFLFIQHSDETPTDLSPETFDKPENTINPNDLNAGESVAITDVNDKRLLDEFRQLENIETAKIDWFKQAEDLLAAGHLVEPEGYNAWYAYQQVLALEPGNYKAQSGLDQVQRLLIAEIEQHLSEQLFDQARDNLARYQMTLEADDDSATDITNLIDTLEQEAEQQAQLKIEAENRQQRLADLQQQLAQLNDVEPLDIGNIAKVHGEILALDPTNTLVLDQAKTLANQGWTTIEQYLNQKSYSQAGRILLALSHERYFSQDEIAQLRTQILSAEDQEQKRQEEELQRAQSILNNNTAEPETTAPTSNPETIIKAPTPTAPIDTPQPTTATADNTQNPAVNDRSVSESQESRLSTGISLLLSGSLNQSVTTLRPLAQQGNQRAQFYLGLAAKLGTYTGIGNNTMNRWTTQATTNIERIARQGQAWAQNDIGLAYEFGIGRPVNITTANQWYSRAQQQGFRIYRNYVILLLNR